MAARARAYRVWWNWRTRPAFPRTPPVPLLASGVDFVLEGLYALKKIGRSDERGYHATETPVRRPRARGACPRRNADAGGSGKKKYYN